MGKSFYEAARIRGMGNLQDVTLRSKCRYVDDAITGHLRMVEGRLKTFIEAMSTDKEQCKARKDMVQQMLWEGSEEARFNIFAWISDTAQGSRIAEEA